MFIDTKLHMGLTDLKRTIRQVEEVLHSEELREFPEIKLDKIETLIREALTPLTADEAMEAAKAKAIANIGQR